MPQDEYRINWYNCFLGYLAALSPKPLWVLRQIYYLWTSCLLWNELIVQTTEVFARYINITYIHNLVVALLNDSVSPYSLTPRSRVLLEKLTVSQLVKEFTLLMGTEISLQRSQVPATCPYPEPDRSSPYPHTPLSEDLSKYCLSIYA